MFAEESNREERFIVRENTGNDRVIYKGHTSRHHVCMTFGTDIKYRVMDWYDKDTGEWVCQTLRSLEPVVRKVRGKYEYLFNVGDIRYIGGHLYHASGFVFDDGGEPDRSGVMWHAIDGHTYKVVTSDDNGPTSHTGQ